MMAKKKTEDAKKLFAQAAQEEKALGYREPLPIHSAGWRDGSGGADAVADWTDAKAAYQGRWWSGRGPVSLYGMAMAASKRRRQGSYRGVFDFVERGRMPTRTSRNSACAPFLAEHARVPIAR